MTGEKRRVGRPRKHAEGPGDYVGFRAPRELKAMLETAASAAGRSLSTEAQFRLERSFHGQIGLQDALENAYGPQGAALLVLLGRLIRGAPGACGLPIEADWLSNPNAFEHAAACIRVAVEALRPSGDVAPETDERAENMALRLFRVLTEREGQGWSASVLTGLGEPTTRRLSAWVNRKEMAQ